MIRAAAGRQADDEDEDARAAAAGPGSGSSEKYSGVKVRVKFAGAGEAVSVCHPCKACCCGRLTACRVEVVAGLG